MLTRWRQSKFSNRYETVVPVGCATPYARGVCKDFHQVFYSVNPSQDGGGKSPPATKIEGPG